MRYKEIDDSEDKFDSLADKYNDYLLAASYLALEYWGIYQDVVYVTAEHFLIFVEWGFVPIIIEFGGCYAKADNRGRSLNWRYQSWNEQGAGTTMSTCLRS
ncbi:hypothetical protein ACPT9H_18235 [Brevibacillus borstelensis]|uniref:hypothetical protein n=1 Tax=Brevibacillus borstelensis TaxID=45462 RepID=UPI003CE5BED8